jgi:hypothetical protein
MTLPAQRALAQISSSSVTRSAPHKHIRRNRHWALWRRRRHRHLTAGVAVHGIVCASVGPGVMAVVERLLLLWGDPRGPRLRVNCSAVLGVAHRYLRGWRARVKGGNRPAPVAAMVTAADPISISSCSITGEQPISAAIAGIDKPSARSARIRLSRSRKRRMRRLNAR